MVVGAPEDIVARPEQTSDIGVGKRGMAYGNLGSQAHLLDVILENRDFGTLVLYGETSGAVEPVEARFSDDIWIEQEKTSDACPRAEPRRSAQTAQALEGLEVTICDRFGIVSVGQKGSFSPCTLRPR